MFLFVPAIWWAPVEAKTTRVSTRDSAANAASPWTTEEQKKQDLSRLLDKIAPEFLVTVTRSALLAMTTSLTRVSTRMYGACQQLGQVLAFDRMARAMFPWAAPAFDPFYFSDLGSWFTGGAFDRATTNAAPFPLASLFWWTGFCQPAPAGASNPWFPLPG
jgi:hypothetical protein